MSFLIGTLVQIFSFCILSSVGQNDLVSVSMIFRHGDRTPFKTYPNDPYRSKSYWSEGFQQLTTRGKIQTYELGQWFRNRYNSFLSEYYHGDDILAVSSGLDYSIASAETFLAGLYPPVQNQKWNADLSWQPIPVHAVPLNFDNLLLNYKPCPKLKELYKELHSSPWFVQIFKDNEQLFSYLRVSTGLPIDNLLDVSFLYDTLLIEHSHNFTLPNWTKSVFPAVLKPFLVLEIKLRTYTTELARFIVGPLLNEIANQLEGMTGTKKVTVYSAHDVVLINFLNSLHLFEDQRPPHTAAVIIELRNKSSNLVVNILYKNSSDDLHKMVFKNCTFDCPLDSFLDIVQPLRLSSNEWDMECYVFKNVESSLYLKNYFIGAVMMAVILVAAFTVYLKLNKKHKK